jgi:hypothetical protein
VQPPAFVASHFSLVANRSHARVEIYIDRGDSDENMCIYDQLHAQKDAIEDAFGGDLIWDPLEGKRACRIKSEKAGNVLDRDQWPAMIDFMTGAMVRMEDAFRRPLAEINRKSEPGEDGTTACTRIRRSDSRRRRKLTDRTATIARFPVYKAVPPQVRCGRPGRGLSRRSCATNALTKGGAMLCQR